MSGIERRALIAGLLAAPALGLRPALAQPAWPSRPVRMVVPYAAGGSSDIVGRLIAARLQASLGQPMVVENRAGAGALLGTEAVARAGTDGHTLLLADTPHAILPALCLAAPYVAYVSRLMRNSLLDVLGSDFMRTARAKGLRPSQALARHAAKVAILPVVTFLGPLAAHLLTGSMVVESVFDISGAGGIFVNAIQNRDAFLLCGAVVVYCGLLIAFNFLVDILYSVLDKRIRLYA